MNFYPHHIGDFNSGTLHMERLERWIYRDMLETYYDQEKPLPADIDKICRLIGIRTSPEREAVISLLDQKFALAEDGYHQSRCDIEIAKYQEYVKVKTKASLAAKAKRDAMTSKISDSTFTWTPHEVHMDSMRTPNQEPRTKNQEPSSYTSPDGLVVPGAAEDGAPASVVPPCPHQEIIALYHEILPVCPPVRAWTEARAAQLRARWREQPERQNLDYWRNFFGYVAGSRFLTWREPGRGGRPFLADLEWLTKQANFTKVREQKYS
jgi:uncharacterized protein YdaU (DUF1376 family)